MSWQEGLILTEEEVRRMSRGGGDLPSSFQCGSDVWLHNFDADGSLTVLEGIVVDVSFSLITGIHYWLAFSVGQGRYVKAGPFRGYITNPNEYIDQDGGFIDLETLQAKVVKAVFPGPRLVVDNTQE